MGFFSKLFGKKKKAEEIKNVNTEAVKVDIVPIEAAPEEALETPTAQDVPTVEEISVEEAPAQEGKAEEESKPEIESAPKTKTVKKIAPKTTAPATACEPPKTEEAAVEAPLEKSTARRARFEIKRTKDDRFVFNLYAVNQVIVATSQIYSSSQSALNGIKSIIANAERAAVEDQTLKEWQPQGFPKWEIYLDNAKQYRFRLDAPNGSCIVHSQGYTSKASCKNGIDSIIRNAKDALIDKAYLIKKDEEK